MAIMKEHKKVVIILVIILIAGILTFKFAADRIISNATALPVQEIAFARIEDGLYQGNYEIFPVKVSVQLRIQNGELTQISLLEHVNGRGQAAEKIVDDILTGQSLQVDNISGATVSSVAIKKAIEAALIEH